MTSTLPASVTAVVTVTCSGLDRPTERHPVWIMRDGSVRAPEHANSTAENVASALGDHSGHACAYWTLAPALLARGGDPVPVPPTADWDIRVVGMWTQRAVWTAMTGLLGRASHLPADPHAVLGYVQAYQEHGGLPSDPEPQVAYLLSPWMRDGGWRRTSQVPAEDLAALLAAGIPTDRAASAAALDVTAEVAAECVPVLRGFGLPADALLPLAYALAPHRLPAFLAALTPQEGRVLPARLAALKEALRTEEMPADRVEAFLRAAATPDN